MCILGEIAVLLGVYKDRILAVEDCVSLMYKPFWYLFTKIASFRLNFSV